MSPGTSTATRLNSGRMSRPYASSVSSWPCAHQVDVELVDADRLELAQLGDRQLGAAEDAEAVADLVRDELAVLRADAGVLVVVIELPRRDEVGERPGDDRAVAAVAVDQVLDVVRDHRGEPAHLLARLGQIGRDVARRADDALEDRRVPARRRCRLAGRVHDPLDDVRVGQLDDDPVADATGDGEGLRPVAGDVHLDPGQLRADPRELELLVVPGHVLAVHERLDHA